MAINRTRLEGADDFLRRLHDIGDKAARKEANKILRKAARPMSDEMKKLAPTRSGVLKRSIRIQRGRKYRELGETVFVGPVYGKNGGNHAHLIELGTRGGVYRAKNAFRKFSIFQPGGGTKRVRRISHPGVKAQPFIAPAFEKKADRSSEILAAELQKIIDRT